MLLRILMTMALGSVVAACDTPSPAASSPVAPPAARAAADPGPLPAARWDGRPEEGEWTRLALAGVDANGQGLLATVPAEVTAYCPRYAQASQADRRAFWVGLMSALARFGSNYNPATGRAS